MIVLVLPPGINGLWFVWLDVYSPVPGGSSRVYCCLDCVFLAGIHVLDSVLDGSMDDGWMGPLK